MNVKRFVGRSSREAMAQVRAVFGADAVVLSNRPCAEGIEILALPGSVIDSIAAANSAPPASFAPLAPMALTQPAAASAAMPAPAPVLLAASHAPAALHLPAALVAPATAVAHAMVGVPAAAAAVPPALFAPVVAPMPAAAAPTALATAPAMAPVIAAQPAAPAADGAPAMSTVSLGERLRERQAGSAQQSNDASPDFPVLSERLTEQELGWLRLAPPRGARQIASEAEADAARLRADLMDEMKALRGFIGEQMTNIAWLDGVKRSPRHGRLLRRLLDNGFSPAVTRKLVSQMPGDCNDPDAQRWLEQVVSHNVATDPSCGLLDAGGVFALIGPTGVGKTTTTAKIAAQFALRHGTQSIGLITVDHYRMGAHDQLRAFGKILGVPVHTAHDSATLADFLQVFVNKKLVLIDTVGVAQRDERVQELLSMLSVPGIRKLIVLNAAAQAATIEDVIAAYGGRTAAGVVISKIDEAVTFGGVVDCVMRHRLRVVGVADGQRVPEDWHAMAAEEMARRALQERPRSVFSIEEGELPAVWTLPAATEQAHA